MPSWNWDESASESGVAHESVTNTDHSDAGLLHQGPSYSSPLFSGDLVAYYPLDEDSGSTAYDVAGTNDGSISGPSLGATGITGTTCYSFDGTDDKVDTPISEFPESFTISAWAQFDDGGSSNALIATNFNNTNSDDVVFGVQNNDEFVFNVDKSGNLSPSSPSVSSGTWYHVVGVADSSSGTTLYVDGSKAGSNSATWSGPHSTSKSIILGISTDGSDALNGPLDDVRLYNRALTSSEVSDLYSLVATTGSWTSTTKTL